MTNSIISQFFTQTHGFAVKDEPGNYALMYTGAIISQPNQYNEENLANHLFKISRGYKQTYYRQVEEKDILKPFDNVWWYFSEEGASCFVLEVDDPAAMSFFNEQYTSKWEESFFYMYVLALIQKFSFLYYTIKTNERLEQSILYQEGDHEISEIENELTETRELYQAILKFQIQASHDHVSYYTHYNELYTQIRKRLRIPELMDELKEKQDTFSQVIELIASKRIAREKEQQEKEEKERREQRQEQTEKQNNIIQTITYILLPATLTTGILGMNIPSITNSNDTLLTCLYCSDDFTMAMSLVINKIKVNRATYYRISDSIYFTYFIFCIHR